MRTAREETKVAFRILDIFQTYSTYGIAIVIFSNFLVLEGTVFSEATCPRGEEGTGDGFQCLLTRHVVGGMVGESTGVAVAAVTILEIELTEPR